MRKKGFLVGILVSILFLATNANAETFGDTVSGKLGGNGSYSTTASILGDYYKYVRIEFTPDSDAKFYVSLIGSNTVAGLGSVKAINPSIELSAKKDTTKIIYILPRSGMACPSDANYCFGTGTNYTKTTVVQGDECSGSMCSIYGIRIKNKKLLTSYGFTLKYEFFK